MSMVKDISIIIPVYNKSTFLQNCIESIIEQQYPCSEILIVDDGSSDDSVIVAERLQKKYEIIKLFTQENQGVSVARNTGLQAARCEWVMFVDPDDLLTHDCLSVLVQNCSESVDIVCACCTVIDNEKRVVDHFFKGNRAFSSEEEKRDLYLQLMDSQYGQPQVAYTAIGVPWGKLYRRSFLLDNHLLFDAKLRRAQDNIFNMYAFAYARKVLYIDQPLYLYAYEHMNAYFSKYRENFKDIFCAVYNARKECVHKISLLDDRLLRECYLEECCKQMISIFKNAVFHKKSDLSYRKKCDLANELYESGFFDNILRLNNVKFCKNVKYRFLWRLIKEKKYFIFNILAKIR